MAKLYYSISEVSRMLGENPSAVRFWSNSFEKFVRPVRNAKGNRQYRESDIEALKQIRFLVKEKGLTLEGASRQMSADRASADKSVKVLDTLKAIRAQLAEIKENI